MIVKNELYNELLKEVIKEKGAQWVKDNQGLIDASWEYTCSLEYGKEGVK